MLMHTYSPVCLPVNWQTELLDPSSDRHELIRTLLGARADIVVQPCTWLFGYGSLEFDNLPMLYQPCAIVKVQDALLDAPIYDNCLGVLHVQLQLDGPLSELSDFDISEQVTAFSRRVFGPVFRVLFTAGQPAPLVEPSQYRFFDWDEHELTSATPLWVARMALAANGETLESAGHWLGYVDSDSAYLALGSGNSLLKDLSCFDDVHRVMVVCQFHAALMAQIEGQLKTTLKHFNSRHYATSIDHSVVESIEKQQYRNDHIEFINIQMSAAVAGTQGKR